MHVCIYPKAEWPPYRGGSKSLWRFQYFRPELLSNSLFPCPIEVVLLWLNQRDSGRWPWLLLDVGRPRRPRDLRPITSGAARILRRDVLSVQTDRARESRSHADRRRGLGSLAAAIASVWNIWFDPGGLRWTAGRRLGVERSVICPTKRFGREMWLFCWAIPEVDGCSSSGFNQAVTFP